MSSLHTVGFDLRDFQRQAVDAWLTGDGQRGRGTLEIATGGGKTLIALACADAVGRDVPDLKLAVVAPTEALARQWVEAIRRHTSLAASQVGMMGASRADSFADHDALVCVLNSAARKLPEDARPFDHVMLVVDECHRAGAPSFSRVLSTHSEFRLGLSATPDREELDDDGEPLAYDEQTVGRALGRVVYRFSLKDARQAGWLPDYQLHHHGVPLTDTELPRYDSVSRRIDDAADSLRGLGGETSRARSLANRNDDVGDAARSWVRLTSERKDLLYRAGFRQDVATRIIERAFAQAAGRRPRAILFHERVDEAIRLHQRLVYALPNEHIVIEHSRLSDGERRRALAAFRDGTAPVLVSVKSLVEGIDVPEADIGVSVASTSSVRQRVQSLGRVLRQSTNADGSAKTAEMHLIYVADTVDELIYGKADWSDLTGADRNHYWIWDDDGQRTQAAGPPMQPRPTEGDAWSTLRDGVLPAVWPGVIVGQEYSVDTTGTVRNAYGSLISNPQQAGDLVAAVRGKPGGRFRVTPEHRIVLVWSADGDDASLWVAGQLDEQFLALAAQLDEAPDRGQLQPGSRYTGPSDKAGGTYKLGQRAGGVIERRRGRVRDLALTADESTDRRHRNAASVLSAWRSLGIPGTTFFVNSLSDAWFERAGQRLFLAHVEQGFEFPDDTDAEGGERAATVHGQHAVERQ